MREWLRSAATNALYRHGTPSWTPFDLALTAAVAEQRKAEIASSQRFGRVDGFNAEEVHSATDAE